MNLRERYFPSRDEIAKRVAEEKAEQQRQEGVAAEFVNSEGYHDLQEWIEEQLLAAEIQSSDHGTMLTQVGFREGLRRVQSHLVELKKLARGEYHV